MFTIIKAFTREAPAFGSRGTIPYTGTMRVRVIGAQFFLPTFVTAFQQPYNGLSYRTAICNGHSGARR